MLTRTAGRSTRLASFALLRGASPRLAARLLGAAFDPPAHGSRSPWPHEAALPRPVHQGGTVMKEQRFDIHQHITNQIIAAIESGADEFCLSWRRSADNIMHPVNIASKNAYRGVNILTLSAAADACG